MKIRLLIRRKDGSSVTLNGTTYQFNDANDHVADVEDEKHADHLLSIEPRVFVEDVPDGDVGNAAGDSDVKDPPPASTDAANKPVSKPRAPRATKEPKAPKAPKEPKEPKE